MKPEVAYGDFAELANEGKFDILVNFTNCQCKIENTIGIQLVELWPSIQEVDNSPEKLNKLGTISRVTISHNNTEIVAANCYVKSKEVDQFMFPAMELCLFKVNVLAGIQLKKFGKCKVAIPKLANPMWPYYLATFTKYITNGTIVIVDPVVKKSLIQNFMNNEAK